jgi:hypothetical protein
MQREQKPQHPSQNNLGDGIISILPAAETLSMIVECEV